MRKWVVRVADAPLSSVTELTTVYAVPGSSSAPAVHDVLSADIVPGTEPERELTATEASVPWSAFTVTRWSTGTSVAPRATLVVTTATGWTEGFVASWAPDWPGSVFNPPAVSPEPPKPHPAAVMDRPSRAATSIDRRARETDIRLPGR